MNDYIYGLMFEERKRELERINREAWKYESFSKPSNHFSLKKLFKTNETQKQANIPCCA